MPKELVISAAPHETRVAILEDGQLCEIYIEREKEFALVGSIYKGRVTRVLPGMQSAFVDIGLDSDAFLYVGDFLENLEDYDHVVTTVEGKVQKMEQQGGEVFAPPASQRGSRASTGCSNRSSDGRRQSARAREPGRLNCQPRPTLQCPASRNPSSSPSEPIHLLLRRRLCGRNAVRAVLDTTVTTATIRDGGAAGAGVMAAEALARAATCLHPSTLHRVRTPRARLDRLPRKLPADYEPIILPGESLAKYKDRCRPLWRSFYRPFELLNLARGRPSAV